MFSKPSLTTFFLLLSSRAFQLADPEANALRLSPAKTACSDLRIADSGDHSSWATPECIVCPRSAAQVASVLQTITATGAPFAIRSGGHSPNLGWSNIEGGVLIDLSRINEITYNPLSTNVVVGTGNRWGAVYSALEAHGRTAVGGRVSPVGVGGFLLGGGLSHVSNEYGLGCDNVVDYEVVLANGTIVNANTNSHSELYWALKGGTSNFGVITRFTLKTVPMSKIWGGVITYNATQAEAVIDAIYTYQTEHISDLKSAISVQFILGAGVVLVTLMYAQSISSSPVAFAPFDSLPYNFYTTTVDMHKDMYQDILSIATDTSEKIAKYQGAALIFVAQTISPTMTAGSAKTGGNALGLPQNTNMMWVNFAAAWELPADDDAVAKACKYGIQKISRTARAKGLSRDYLFMNDAGEDQDVLGSYGSENRAGLRKVAREVDPEGVFQILETGGFKL
ncbi:FAD-binding domain-containing protein [Choiromyces venosus 120613-1]|uniref:FAD-binding domain-containing protein n=1 Tax=Choiromyces venosus 120613-1 TaxID=1336337 RepID=A0A3N4JFF4_9PEZI|nr:FAD-binding domain-containing protein [Choiromyces venosus 120613-1]